MESYSRPNRSDTHLSTEEEAKILDQTREHFDDLAPKRHSKPQRSDHSSSYLDANTASNAIPEFNEFQRLEGEKEKLEYSSVKETDEFVETDYYKDLNGVGEQHHTTGTGFIEVENVKRKQYEMEEDHECPTDSYSKGSGHGNPATNDWVPAGGADQGN